MSEPQVDLAWMRLLVEVDRKGSLSAAAEALGLSQPAVSYQIRLLEQRFGLPLLQRLHRGVRFTEEGRRLLEIAERTVSDVDSLQRSLRTARRGPTVRLATDYAFSSLWLIPRMHVFRQSHPEIDLQIVATQRLGHHWREDADLAVAFGTGSEFGAGSTGLPIWPVWGFPRTLRPDRATCVSTPMRLLFRPPWLAKGLHSDGWVSSTTCWMPIFWSLPARCSPFPGGGTGWSPAARVMRSPILPGGSSQRSQTGARNSWAIEQQRNLPIAQLA
jgi:DNA-binding transcriptional LysR family regulator